MKWSDLQRACSSSVVGNDFEVGEISTDTRTIKMNDVFLALKGPTFDGHDYIDQAIENGARGVICSQPMVTSVPQINVKDTQVAYGQIARYYRDKIWSGTVIGVTGSVGKTSTKEMLQTVLSRYKSSQCSKNNENNEIGVPKTLLNLASKTEYGIIEMGACKPGDISYLMDIVNPDISILTACAPVHIEFYESLQGIAHEKGQVFERLKQEGVAIINADDPFFSYWKTMTKASVLSFGLNPDADVQGIIDRLEDKQTVFTVLYQSQGVQINLPVPGKHMVQNALAVIACALSIGMPLKKVKAPLEAFKTMGGRLKHHSLPNGVQLIDDAYNANPVAVKAAIDVLCSQRPADKWLVLSDMLELGEFSEKSHIEIGLYAHKQGINRLLTVGPGAQKAADSFGSGALHFDNNETLLAYLTEHLMGDVCCLMKGSYSTKLHEVVQSILSKQELSV